MAQMAHSIVENWSGRSEKVKAPVTLEEPNGWQPGDKVAYRDDLGCVIDCTVLSRHEPTRRKLRFDLEPDLAPASGGDSRGYAEAPFVIPRHPSSLQGATGGSSRNRSSKRFLRDPVASRQSWLQNCTPSDGSWR